MRRVVIDNATDAEVIVTIFPTRAATAKRKRQVCPDVIIFGRLAIIPTGSIDQLIDAAAAFAVPFPINDFGNNKGDDLIALFEQLI